jgi:hypothetical protein
MIKRINKTMNDGREFSKKKTFFFTHNYTPTILTNKKAAMFGSSKLRGRTAPGLLLATWGGSFAIGDAAPDVLIPYGAP